MGFDSILAPHIILGNVIRLERDAIRWRAIRAYWDLRFLAPPFLRCEKMYIVKVLGPNLSSGAGFDTSVDHNR